MGDEIGLNTRCHAFIGEPCSTAAYHALLGSDGRDAARRIVDLQAFAAPAAPCRSASDDFGRHLSDRGHP